MNPPGGGADTVEEEPELRRETKRQRKQQGRGSLRRASDFHVLRYVPGSSPIHRMWAGTKLLWFAVLSIGLLIWPRWQAVGLGACVVVGAFLVARLPRGVTPPPPRWLRWLILIGVVIAVAAGGSPYLHLGHLKIGFGGLDQFARFWVITIEILASAALVSWTTPLADLTPALGRLLAPARHLKVPVDELVGAVGLSIRCLPLLLEEARVMSAARRARQIGINRSTRSRAQDVEDIIWTSLGNALRRSRELAEAIEARGGVPTVAPETHTMAGGDAVMLLVAAAAVAGMALIQ